MHLFIYIQRNKLVSLKFEKNMIVVAVFILNQMEFCLVDNQNENCHHDRIPFNLKGIRYL